MLPSACGRLGAVGWPVRFSIVSYNIWNNQRWPDRADALGLFARRYWPDVLCVQELVPETRAFLDDALHAHTRVEDPFTGWATESNIWWRRDLFDYLEHGAAEFGCKAYPNRRLFWVRLRPRSHPSSLVVATVHLTDFGTAHELETGESPRVAEAHRIVAALDEIVREQEAAVVVGDFNDALAPLVPLLIAGYTSCFGALDQIPPMTLPSSLDRFGGGGFASAFLLDWVLANHNLRALSASSPHIYANDIAPSDHWPVHAVYEVIESAVDGST